MTHATKTAPNPIVAIARETWDTHDAHACASEWLFQTLRLAAEFDVPHDIHYRDPSGPASLEDSLETGEDTAYWDAVLALLEHQNFFTAQSTVSAWHEGTVPPWFDTARAAKQIDIALKTFDRIYRMTKEDN